MTESPGWARGSTSSDSSSSSSVAAAAGIWSAADSSMNRPRLSFMSIPFDLPDAPTQSRHGSQPPLSLVRTPRSLSRAILDPRMRVRRGDGGIRTPDTVAGILDFESSAFSQTRPHLQTRGVVAGRHRLVNSLCRGLHRPGARTLRTRKENCVAPTASPALKASPSEVPPLRLGAGQAELAA